MPTPLSPTTEGRWAVVTGGSSGIGRAHAFELAARGFDVVLVGRDQARLDSTAAELSTRHGVVAEPATIDLSDDRAAEALLAQLGDREVGVFVATAGTGAPGDFTDVALDYYLNCVNVKVRNNVALLHTFASGMRERGAGALLIISSTGALQGVASLSVNAASEAFLLSLSEALHDELRPHGVRVTGLMPGPTDTPGLRSMLGDQKRPPGVMTAEATAREGMRALEAGRRSHVASASTRAMVRVLPRPLRIRLFSRMLGRLFAAGTADQRNPHLA